MNTLQTYREKKRLTQTALAALTNIPRRRLSDYENGVRLLSDDQIDRLEEVLECRHRLLRARHYLTSAAIPEDSSSRPYEVDAPTGLTLEKCGHQFRSVRQFLSLAAPNEALQIYFGVDTGTEGLFWTHLQTGQSQLALASPVEFGFDEHCLLDGTKALGLKKRACVYSSSDDLTYIAWPQLTLMGPGYCYRVDALVLAISGRERRWSIHEVNGDGHRETYDRERERKLRLPVFYYTTEQLHNPSFRERFVENLRSLLANSAGVRKSA